MTTEEIEAISNATTKHIQTMKDDIIKRNAIITKEATEDKGFWGNIKKIADRIRSLREITGFVFYILGIIFMIYKLINP